MITLDFTTPISDARRDAFARAADRWDVIIDTAFEPINFEGRQLDGLLIEVSIAPIDGPDGVLGQAGPTALRPGSELPVAGIMQFDTADVERLETNASFEDVVLHEMAHVLGFGTLWARAGLVQASGTNDPRFNGPEATREYRDLGGSEAAVPIANTGGAGTREGHWRELVFGDELLTGFLSGAERPISRLSIASFQDLGYDVDLAAADAYTLPDFRALAEMGITEAVRICDLCRMGRPEPIVLP
ncbi:leishmanolysin-related zinc metalloendopeptidase [Roseobacter sp.]|uniref:leishmanolysin-related zinc metalloendopeptidase n=1 Tax=Roseobacter sp. TaxID=1907202 RepID=UPI00296699C9|nr:leishmanolysin-related zinc metalloendopeptidase [Roseobacter sp.]MDW3181692.1 leishmanolysin-related zinc metalloendopeptidase [Roseobacter sp.]